MSPTCPEKSYRIELTPPAGFWMINDLAVDYSDDIPLEPQEIEAVAAVDSNGVDIRPLLASTDDCYFAMPNTGDNAEVVFPVPPSSIGTERTLFLKASGYYDIHMGALGEPQHDTLIKIRREPGYAARYAWGEYLQWQKRKTGGESALDVGSLPETLTRMIGGFPAIPVLVRRTAGLLGYWLRKRKFPFFRLSARKGGYLRTRRISRELKLNKFAETGQPLFLLSQPSRLAVESL